MLAQASTTIDDPSFIQIWNLLDIISIFSDNEQCEPGLIFWLIEELLDSQTIDGCRKVFDYLESRRERITAKHFKQKNLIILRSCNELLRRLSRAEDTVFCGRVFIFLFQSFPLGDKSSVNLRGEYHVENVTTFDELSEKPENVVQDMEVDHEVEDQQVVDATTAQVVVVQESASGAPTESDQVMKAAKSVTFDAQAAVEMSLDMDSLYPIFWTLQQDFSNPTRLFEPARFESFKRGLESTITKFKEVQNELDGRGVAKVSEDRRGTKRKRGERGDDLASNFNPKYLTSRDLFELEVSDLAFRRHILLQALILVDFLLSLTPKAKSKLADLTNKSVLYGYTLNDEDTKWANHVKSMIATYLQQGPEGKFYYRMVDTVLSRDKNWVRWKAENCPPIERPPVSAQEFLDARSGTQKASAVKRLRAVPLGSLDISFLSDAENLNGLERLTAPDRQVCNDGHHGCALTLCRYTVPTAESFQRAIEEDDFDIQMAKTDEDKQLSTNARASKLWRTLRIASKSKLNSFDKIDDGNNLQALFRPEGETEKAGVEYSKDSPNIRLDVAYAESSAQAALKATSALEAGARSDVTVK
ncbi:MAG: hypothetical protein M1830_005266 [Pleopsidium flavum]|nr:MAG: hypothetical protein M1830_005266 [Pleopsidium flavum]